MTASFPNLSGRPSPTLASLAGLTVAGFAGVAGLWWLLSVDEV